MFAGLAVHTRSRVAHHLQRLQGRRLHPHRADRPQARQEGHPRRREALRGASRSSRIAKEMGVEPLIGLRVRLVAKGAGKWATSGGEHAKFGLSTAEILEADRDPARRRDELARSSSSTSTSARRSRTSSPSSAPCARRRGTTRSSARWATRIEYLDVGGGLAIDYDGSRSTFHSSMNYSVEEYARDVVYNIMRRLRRREGAAPEHRLRVGPRDRRAPLRARGRGLRRDREDAARADRASRPQRPQARQASCSTSSEHLARAQPRRVVARPRCRSRRRRRRCSSSASSTSTSRRASRRSSGRSPSGSQSIADELDPSEVPGGHLPTCETELADQHICNFSVFQSLLDHWALGAALPDRADPPARRAAAARRARSSTSPATPTARSRKFIDLNDVRDTLPLHDIRTTSRTTSASS